MSFDYINEAFRKLNMLEEDVFDTSIGGLNNLSTFLDNDDEDIVKVIDPEAETEENLSNSYVGKVIIDCNVCHSKIFSEKSDIVLSEDGVVNPEEQCPYCGETSGFTVVGEIKEFEQDTVEETPEDETETPVDETPAEETETPEGEEKPKVEEALTEELSAENSQDDEPINELFDVNLDARGFGGSGNNVSVLGGKIPAFEQLNDELEEGAFSGGYAGDNSSSGGTIRGRGASTQPSKSSYLRRLQSKNPELVDITTVKGKDIKPGMITQAGQVKTAEVKRNNRGETKVYIMHTNNYDGFWDVDEDMEVLVDPENKSQPFTGSYSALLKMGLQESADMPSDESSLTEEFDAFTAVSTFLTGKGYDVSSKDGKAYVWGVVDYLDLGGITPTTENLESWLKDTLADEEYKSELESCCGQNSLEEAYFKPVDGEPGVKRALIDSCDEFTVTLLEITDEDGTWYEVGINHPTKDFEQVEIGEYRTEKFAESIAQRVVSMLTKYVELEELTSIYEFGTRSIYDKVASKMPETEPTTEELNEDIQNLSLTTDETQVKLTSDENGKVTLVTEPVIKEEAEPEVVEEEPVADGELEIAPVSDETVDAIVDNNDVETEEEIVEEEPVEEPVEETDEEDVALDEVDEEGLDELGESYMKAVYENVESFKTTNVSANDTHIVVEGLIKFASGTERKTGFIFEAHTATDNKVNFKGCNEHFSKDRNCFTLNCSVVDRKLLPESLSYNYNVDGKKISGTVTRKGV